MDLYICIKQVPWQKPVLLLDLPSQSNAQSKSTPLSSIDIKMFYHLTMKGQAIPAIPPQGYSAVALVGTIAETCLPWAHTTQNDRKEEIAFSFHGITKTFLTCFCSKSSSFDFCLVLSIQISKLRHINYRDLQKYGCVSKIEWFQIVHLFETPCALNFDLIILCWLGVLQDRQAASWYGSQERLICFEDFECRELIHILCSARGALRGGSSLHLETWIQKGIEIKKNKEALAKDFRH